MNSLAHKVALVTGVTRRQGIGAAVALALAQAGAGVYTAVNAVDPGPTETGWMREEQRAALLATAPMGRLGTPQDAARVVAFLASEAAGWVTGQVIRARGSS